MLAEDASTYVVMMEGAGDKAFCAGGDIRGRMIYNCVTVQLFVGCTTVQPRLPESRLSVPSIIQTLEPTKLQS